MDSPIKGKSQLRPIQQRIIELLRVDGPMTRAELVEELCRPRTTVYGYLKKLIERQIITKTKLNQHSKRGRPEVFYKIVQ